VIIACLLSLHSVCTSLRSIFISQQISRSCFRICRTYSKTAMCSFMLDLNTTIMTIDHSYLRLYYSLRSCDRALPQARKIIYEHPTTLKNICNYALDSTNRFDKCLVFLALVPIHAHDQPSVL
jgi:hypothetical protein